MPDPVASSAILGLFPDIEEIGGVQLSGRVAWEKIVDPADSHFKDVSLFSYGRRKRSLTYNGANEIHVSSRLGGIIAALRERATFQLVLVWHLSLLKLLPFFHVPGAKLVVFLHGIEAWRRQNWFIRRLLKRVDLFLANSSHTWERFVSFNTELTNAQHCTVHLGVGLPLTGPTPEPSETAAALMISRLVGSEDYKGHRSMIAAWPRVLERKPGAQLWIVGDGDLRSELERLVEHRNLCQRVRFWGWVSEARKHELLAQCRCLALPSRGEGFGMVYLEAMRMGRPCIVSNMDAGREVVDPPIAGLAADPAEPPQLVEAVCRALTPGEEWDRWSKQARSRYEANFTAKHFQKRLMDALNPLCCS